MTPPATVVLTVAYSRDGLAHLHRPGCAAAKGGRYGGPDRFTVPFEVADLDAVRTTGQDLDGAEYVAHRCTADLTPITKDPTP